MQTMLTFTLVAALAGATPPSGGAAAERLVAQVAEQVRQALERAAEAREHALERAAEEWERALERANEERSRARERAAEELERAAERREGELERASEAAERARERAEQQTEREREQRERELERAREQRETELERAREQREAAQERAREQREREQERREQELERAREQREREQERAREQREREQERAREQRDRQRGQFVQTDRQTRTVRIGSAGELDIENIAGDIVITRGSGNDVTVEILKTARARSDADAKDVLQLVPVDVVERGPRVEIRTRYPHDEWRRSNRRHIDVTVALNITAPAGTRVRAHSISGSVSATDIKGEVSLESVSGSIRVANGGRVSAAKSMSGNIEVLDTTIDGPLEASTASGTVTLRRVKARSLDVGSISGGVVLEDVECQMLEAQSVSGEVRFGGALAKNGRYELSSHSGTVRVALSSGSGFELEATTFSGSVQSDFPVTARRADGPGSKSLRGVYGGGGAILDLTSFSGNVVISKR
jgi:hypothetical protein